MTPTLSVEAVQLRLICPAMALLAVRPGGTEGGVVSVEPPPAPASHDTAFRWMSALSYVATAQPS